MSTTPLPPAIRYDCYFSKPEEGEYLIPEHGLGMILAGTATLYDGLRTQSVGAGDIFFCRRNALVRFAKQLSPAGEFRSLGVALDQPLLRAFSAEHHLEATLPPGPAALATPAAGFAVLPPSALLPASAVLAAFLHGLEGYETLLAQPQMASLLRLKQHEAIWLLLQAAPALQPVLFDFAEPGKLNLEAFMHQHYRFNVDLKHFAYLTGRSISTFKRDFQQVFQTTPSRWLVRRRLQEAYHLMRDLGKKASEVYLEVGFEDLSHFSYAFKKEYGLSPSAV